MGVACFLGHPAGRVRINFKPLFAKGSPGAVIDTGTWACLNRMLSLNCVPPVGKLKS